MIKEIDDLYCCLENLEEAYYSESPNARECLTINDARLKLESAISNAETLLTHLISQNKGTGVRV